MIDDSASTSPSAPGAALQGRLANLTADLQQAFLALLSGVIGDASLRPVRLTETLSLDKSLASRVVRALRASDPMEALHELPTPQGLAIVRSRAEKAGADAQLLAEAARAEQRYVALLGEFSGGRSDLDTAISSWLPALRTKSLRRARRDIFRGNAMVLGIRSDCFYAAYFLLPGERPGSVDTAWLTVRQGLRRLRVDLPVQIAGIQGTEGAYTSKRQSLLGRPVLDDPRALLIDAASTTEERDLDVVHTHDRILLVLAGDSPAINVPVDVAVGGFTPDQHGTRASEEQSHIWFELATRQPTERAVVDLFVHDALKLTARPVVTRVLEGTHDYGRGSRPEDMGDHAVSPEWQMKSLGRGASAIRSADVRGLPEVVELACGARGVELGDLACHRLREEFPLPTMATTVWLELPDGGARQRPMP